MSKDLLEMKQKKRVLCISAYLPGNGGIEKVILSLHPELMRLNYRLDLCILSVPKYPDWHIDIDGRHYSIFSPDGDSFHRDIFVKYCILAKALRSELKKMYDIVIYTHTFLGLAIYLTKKKMKLKDPILFWPNCSLYSQGASGIIKKAYIYCNCFFANGYLEVSNQIHCQLVHLYPKRKHKLVYNPLNPSVAGPIKKSTDKIKKFIYIARLEDRQKNISFMLKGLSLLIKSGLDNWHLTIVGDGPSALMLHSIAENLNLDGHLTWLGYLPSPWDHIEEADCLLLTSRAEGLPLVLGDAIQHGCPVISSDCPGSVDIVQHGVNGWLYSEGDMNAFVRLLSNFIEGKLTIRDQRMMINSISKFQVGNVARRFADIFDEVLSDQKYGN